jgi:O-antigen/teichoic acid export membrane protein
MYGYFRGRSEFKVANAVHVVGVAALPVVLLVVAGGSSIETLIALMAVGLIACCAVVTARPFLRGALEFERAGSVAAARTLLNYGYRRVPGEVAGVVLFTVPIVLAAHFVSLDEVAYLTAGLYVLFMISIASQPVGLVFLPVLSRLCETDFEAARRYVGELTRSALHIGLFITPQLVLFADVAIRAWLGSDFDDAGTIIAITVFPAGVYLINVMLRSALDAAAVTAYNGRNNLISLAVCALVAAGSLAADLADPLNCIAWSLALGVLCLGVLTLVSVTRVYGLRVGEFSLPVAAALACLTAAAAWLVDRSVIGGDDSIGAIGLIAALQIVLGALYFAGLLRAGVAWPRLLLDRLPGRRAS